MRNRFVAYLAGTTEELLNANISKKLGYALYFSETMLAAWGISDHDYSKFFSNPILADTVNYTTLLVGYSSLIDGMSRISDFVNNFRQRTKWDVQGVIGEIRESLQIRRAKKSVENS